MRVVADWIWDKARMGRVASEAVAAVWARNSRREERTMRFTIQRWTPTHAQKTRMNGPPGNFRSGPRSDISGARGQWAQVGYEVVGDCAGMRVGEAGSSKAMARIGRRKRFMR